MRLKAGTQAPRLFLPELNTNLTMKKQETSQPYHVQYMLQRSDPSATLAWLSYGLFFLYVHICKI